MHLRREPAPELVEVQYHAARSLVLSLRRLSIHYLQKITVVSEAKCLTNGILDVM